MLDPFFEWIAGLWRALIRSIHGLWRMLTSPFRATYGFYQRSGWAIRGLLLLLLIPLLLAYAHFAWHTIWIRDYDNDYPHEVSARRSYAFSRRTGRGGRRTGHDQNLRPLEHRRSDGRSHRLQCQPQQLDFKPPALQGGVVLGGRVGIRPGSSTTRQRSNAVSTRQPARTAIELADALGRTRGTSQIDTDLKVAKGNIQFDQFTWYFNLFDRQPIGPTTPTPTYYRAAFKALADYNKRLTACHATFDARADNLLQFLDRIAKDIGSTSAAIKDRAEQNNSGWFDTRADDIFMYAKGQLYGYYGILQAARADFPEVVENRALADIWDHMDEHLRRAIELDPLIISNGDEDGWLMPTHLTTMGFYILRARSNLVEIRSVLDR